MRMWHQENKNEKLLKGYIASEKEVENHKNYLTKFKKKLF